MFAYTARGGMQSSMVLVKTKKRGMHAFGLAMETDENLAQTQRSNRNLCSDLLCVCKSLHTDGEWIQMFVHL